MRPVQASVTGGVVLLLAGCASPPQTMAKQAPGHTPTTPSIDCEVTTGPNKGKRGTRTEDGWCEGDWGGTECRPRTKCKDVDTTVSDGATRQPQAPSTRGIAPTGNTPVVGIRPPVGSGPNRYCQLDDNVLSVRFANSGGVAARAGTNVTVTFQGSSPTSVSGRMPAIPPGGVVDMAFPVPRDCFASDCRFTIQWSNQPPVSGICIG